MATIQFSITVPDDKQAEIVQVFTDYHGYTAAAGVTRAEFARRLVIDFVRSSVRSHRAQKAAEDAHGRRLWRRWMGLGWSSRNAKGKRGKQKAGRGTLAPMPGLFLLGG